MVLSHGGHLRHGLAAQVLDGLVVEDDAIVAHDAIVAVAVVRVKRHVRVHLLSHTRNSLHTGRRSGSAAPHATCQFAASTVRIGSQAAVQNDVKARRVQWSQRMAVKTRLQVGEGVFEQRDGALGEAVGVERLLAGRRLQVVRRLQPALQERVHRPILPQTASAGSPRLVSCGASTRPRPANKGLQKEWMRLGGIVMMLEKITCNTSLLGSTMTHRCAFKSHPMCTTIPPALGRLTLGKMTTWLTPSDRASATFSSSPWRQPRRSTPGMEAMGTFCSPSCTKTGRIRFAGDMCVSLMACRKAPLRRLRRGRDGRSCRRSRP